MKEHMKKLKKSQSKIRINIFIAISSFCLTTLANAQNKDCDIVFDNLKIIEQSENSRTMEYEIPAEVNHKFKLKFSNLTTYYKDNKLYVNNQQAYCFANIEFYERFIHFTKDKKDYIYIYPQYKNYYTPYTHLELGILVEVNNNNFIIKENIDSVFAFFEICELMNFKKFKITAQPNNKCAGSEIAQ